MLKKQSAKPRAPVHTNVITHMRVKMMNAFVFTIVCHERDSACEHLTAASHAIRIV